MYTRNRARCPGNIGRRDHMAAYIIDRGRGPELEGTRVTVYCILDYVRAGDSRSRIAEELDLSDEQVQAVLDYINPKFQGSPTGISILINDLHQTRVPVSGYILISLSASACNSSASVTW